MPKIDENKNSLDNSRRLTDDQYASAISVTLTFELVTFST